MENFDYQSIRDDLVKNVIASEIYFDKFHFYEIKKNEYTSVIKNLECYLTISNHLLNRSVYPVVLENVYASKSLDLNYKYSYFNIYLEKNISIEDSAKLKKNCAIGKDSKIGQNCIIIDSVVGRNVSIGSNTTIRNSIIFGECVIKDNCKIENSVICYKSVIEENTTIQDCYTESNIVIPSEEYLQSRITKDLDSEQANEIAFVKNADFELNNLEDKDLLFITNKENHHSFNQDESEEEFSCSEKEEDSAEEPSKFIISKKRF